MRYALLSSLCVAAVASLSGAPPNDPAIVTALDAIRVKHGFPALGWASRQCRAAN